MGKTYRKGAYTKGKKVLEGNGGISKQEKNPVSTEKTLKVKTLGKTQTLVVQEAHKGDEDLKKFIHYLNSIQTSIEIVSEYLKGTTYKLVYGYRIKSPIDYEGNINYDWFTHQLSLPTTVDKSHIIDKDYIQSHKKILLKDKYVYCEVDYIREAEVIERPVTLWAGRSTGYDDWNIEGKKHKFRKEKARMESSMKELQDNIHYFGYIIYM